MYKDMDDTKIYKNILIGYRENIKYSSGLVFAAQSRPTYIQGGPKK